MRIIKIAKDKIEKGDVAEVAEDVDVAEDVEDSNLTSQVEGFLKNMNMFGGKGLSERGYYYSSPADLLLQHGRHYTSQNLTNKEMLYLKELYKETKRYKMKECFYNAQSLSQFSKNRIKYAEGYLFSGILPLEHGWNTLNGKVLDFTMAHANQNKPILGIIPEGWDYFGMNLPNKMIIQYWAKSGKSGSLINNWIEGHPLLKEKFKE